MFLSLNGYRLEPDEIEGVHLVTGVAAGEIAEDMFADWIADFTIRNP